MISNNYKKVLTWFRYILKDEINTAVNFFNSHIEDMKSEKRNKSIKKAYSEEQYEALEWVNKLNIYEQEKIAVLLQFYTSDSFRYFFRRLEEGEASGDIGRINFELRAINDTTGEETLLISADENDDIDNDFQGWILDNCSGLEEDNVLSHRRVPRKRNN